MSEFACRKGHLMRSGEYTCKICGGRLYTMDGQTFRQIEAEEKYYESMEKQDEE